MQIWRDNERNKPKKQMKLYYSLHIFETGFKKWAKNVVKDIVIDHVPRYLEHCEDLKQMESVSDSRITVAEDPVMRKALPAERKVIEPLKLDSLRQKIG